MFLGWYDRDKQKSARAKVEEAIERYREKFGSEPTTAMVSVLEVEELTASGEPFEGFTYQGKSFIPRFTFYVGVEEPEPAEGDFL